ncbi:DNA topoisomerase I, mitochondrial-like [Sphaerodactylus townsendi]|uniref:DNA topoisomerase I, mitochondrial-like n=1 Tax=Sphaerodactylus townsendi TaxID=933632 RepID=UPI002025F11A|nr:DNA topoisomerase I, mitochondrial-like [Sphaerodactylus townsendi]
MWRKWGCLGLGLCWLGGPSVSYEPSPAFLCNVLTFALQRFCAFHKRVQTPKVRWEEEKREDGIKWQRLEHNGPYFAPPYVPLPDDVRFYYNGKPMKLSPAAEEIATFYAKMLDHDYTGKAIFQNNFFSDWTKEITSGRAERSIREPESVIARYPC